MGTFKVIVSVPALGGMLGVDYKNKKRVEKREKKKKKNKASNRETEHNKEKEKQKDGFKHENNDETCRRHERFFA